MENHNQDEYEKFKSRVLAWFEVKEMEIQKLSRLWRTSKSAELNRKKEKMLGPELKKAKDKKPLRYWIDQAAECRRGITEAIAIRNYERALLSEGWARYAEFQADLRRIGEP